MEYGAALLMNLSLRSAGKAAAADESLGILGVLSELLESSNPQVRTSISGKTLKPKCPRALVP